MASYDDDPADLPPPYAATPDPAAAVPGPVLPVSVTDALAAPLVAHLAALTTRLRAAAASRRASRDFDALHLLVPHVSAFLSRLERRRTHSPRAAPPSGASSVAVGELVLVPAAAVPPGWALTGAAERRRDGEFVSVVKVGDAGRHHQLQGKEGGSTTKEGVDTKNSEASNGGHQGDDDDDDDELEDPDDDKDACGDGRWRSVPEFDEWGRWEGDADDDRDRDLWWWRDEDMARRLAAYLRPATVPLPPSTLGTYATAQPSATTAKEPRKGWGWGRKKSDTRAPSSSPVPVPVPSPVPQSAAGSVLPVSGKDPANMSVRADEVTFRKENEFGVWESLSGFGIVVSLRIREL